MQCNIIKQNAKIIYFLHCTKAFRITLKGISVHITALVHVYLHEIHTLFKQNMKYLYCKTIKILKSLNTYIY